MIDCDFINEKEELSFNHYKITFTLNNYSDDINLINVYDTAKHKQVGSHHWDIKETSPSWIGARGIITMIKSNLDEYYMTRAFMNKERVDDEAFSFEEFSKDRIDLFRSFVSKETYEAIANNLKKSRI